MRDVTLKSSGMLRCVPARAAKTCAVRPVFARVAGEQIQEFV